MIVISRETIGELFENGENATEGWGVFLVRDPAGQERLEVQRLDEKGVFSTDTDARAWLWGMAVAGGRHRGVLELVRQVSAEAYQQVFMAGMWAERPAAKAG